MAGPLQCLIKTLPQRWTNCISNFSWPWSLAEKYQIACTIIHLGYPRIYQHIQVWYRLRADLCRHWCIGLNHKKYKDKWHCLWTTGCRH